MMPATRKVSLHHRRPSVEHSPSPSDSEDDASHTQLASFRSASSASDSSSEEGVEEHLSLATPAEDSGLFAELKILEGKYSVLRLFSRRCTCSSNCIQRVDIPDRVSDALHQSDNDALSALSDMRDLAIWEAIFAEYMYRSVRHTATKYQARRDKAQHKFDALDHDARDCVQAATSTTQDLSEGQRHQENSRVLKYHLITLDFTVGLV
jgi:hypothetical protein